MPTLTYVLGNRFMKNAPALNLVSQHFPIQIFLLDLTSLPDCYYLPGDRLPQQCYVEVPPVHRRAFVAIELTANARRQLREVCV